ncbi:MAG: endonuclease YncB(thermonuclease family) [Verrucomicrobiales bacterium]|jgi:endonuclease YncB( thermonuclease family)
MQKKVASALGFSLIAFIAIFISLIAFIAIFNHFTDLENESGDSGGEKSKPKSGAPSPSTSAKSVNGYEQLLGCRMVDHRNNDGDSFFVRHGEREFELRLYFADCAEKYYSDRHEDQRNRVKDQAKDFGGLSVEQTIQLGQKAKGFVAALLRDGSFKVYTDWERVYGGERFHGFVEIDDPDARSEKIFLCELLVREGLARIHTGGASTPDGRSERGFEADLEDLERMARKAKKGAWRL